ncbi:peroxiredoxin-like family protein [Aeromicrobium sp. CTD01-1L150]|uniref:peroxiredoxin-like family protein n=1 Tax=Aeromicrobium sp. CTD01-1L150 TaxID=3341830 RepID=UPI0035C1925C
MEAQKQPRRLKAGDRVAGRTLTTIAGTNVELLDPVGVTHLQFRRFAACPICNLHLRRVAARLEEIEAAGVRELVVFHSEVSAMLPHQGDVPFAAIADPRRMLYDEFGVEVSPRALLSPAAWAAPLRLQSWRVALRELRDPGSRPFHIRGGSMSGLPAEFLITPDGLVRAAKYGRHANDQWAVDELLHLAATATTDSR